MSEIQNSQPIGKSRSGAHETRLRRLLAEYEGVEGLPLVRAMLNEFRGDVAVVSSFGAEAAVLLHMVARVDPATPVLFLNTGKLFPETLEYAERLAARLELTDVRYIEPDPKTLIATDTDGFLWRSDPDRCCHVRKVAPLDAALAEFGAWMSGLKRYHNFVRANIHPVEIVDGKLKISPLATWGTDRVQRAFKEYGLPRHKLVAEGYPSIGCLPCTTPVEAGDDPRAGRWAGSEKTECGIHRPIFGERG